jgi:hypothetical protein
MKRDIVFIVNDREHRQPDDVEIHVRFSVFKPHDRACMDVRLVQEQTVFDSANNPARAPIALHEQRVPLPREDVQLAQAANSTDGELAQDIAHGLFWKHAVMPSLLAEGPDWLQEHAPAYWHAVARVVFADRERRCAEVQEQ